MARFLPLLVLLANAAGANGQKPTATSQKQPNPERPSPERMVTSILPSLDYGPTCWSTVTLSNLGDRAVTIDLEAHRAGGGLVGLDGLDSMILHLAPGERLAPRLAITDESGVGWLKVREHVPAPNLTPVVAVSALSECTVENQLRSTPRQLSYPTRNPWFSGDIEDMSTNMITVVNTSERAAVASLCYSQGNLYSVPTDAHPNAELKLVCSDSFDVLIPPYATRQFPVHRPDSTHFSIKTIGDAIVLQMMHPVAAGVKVYSVDSTVKFGGEFADK
jgi:hypothetical protein